MAHGETVLVVEDNRDVSAFVRQVLQEHGFDIQEAATGWAALQLATGFSPDVLVLDWQLPDITGLDVLQALRAGNCLAPAILMTGYGSEALAITALRLGVREYLRKPFGADDLIQAVESALIEGRLRRERESLREQLAEATHRLESYTQRINTAQKLLGKLASLTDDLKHSRGEDQDARILEMRRYLLQIAETLMGPASTPKPAPVQQKESHK